MAVNDKNTGILESDGFNKAQIAVYRTVFRITEKIPEEREKELFELYVTKKLTSNEAYTDEEFKSMSYPELCFVHNALGSCVDELLANTELEKSEKHEQTEYLLDFKRALRSAVLARLRESTLYVALARVNDLPLRHEGGVMFVFTMKDKAEEWNAYPGERRILEVPAALFEKVFSEYYITGYKKVTVDLLAEISLTELYHIREDNEYGIHSPEVCAGIIDFNQMLEIFRVKAAEEKRETNEAEQRRINEMSTALTESLVEADLIVTYSVETKDGNEVKSAPVLTDKAGKKWLILFTDAAAVSRFYKGKTEGLKVAPETLFDFYENMLGKDGAIEGVIINPTRENFRLPSKYLEHFTASSELAELQKKCRTLQEADSEKGVDPTPETEKARRELAKKLLVEKCIYAAFDGDFRKIFPFIREDGRLELFTKLKYANGAAAQYAAKNCGTMVVNRIPSERFEGFFRTMEHFGVKSFLLDNGGIMTELLISDLYPPMENENVIEKTGTVLRGLSLRELQLSYRGRKYLSKKSDEEKKNYDSVRSFLRMLLYGELSVGLYYVLAEGTYTPGVTLYTKSALEVAKARAAKHGMKESALLAPGDKECAVYDGKLKLRMIAAPKDEKKVPFVCAFSDRVTLERMRRSMAESENKINDAVIVVTFDELAAQAKEAGGFVLDADTFGLTVMKEELPKIVEFRTKNSAQS